MLKQTQDFCAAFDSRFIAKPALPLHQATGDQVITQDEADTTSCGWIVLLHFARQLAALDDLHVSDRFTLKPIGNLSYHTATKQMKVLLLHSITRGIHRSALIPHLARQVGNHGSSLL